TPGHGVDDVHAHSSSESGMTDNDALDAEAQRLVVDLHTPRPVIFWTDLILSGAIGWGAFAVAVAAPPWSAAMFAAMILSALALYRGLCFTHELTHLRRRAVPGFELTWNLVFGVPLLLPSFTYIGVHQSHHNLSTYGTKADPEYLPFASSRKMLIVFGIQSSLLIPVLLWIRFLVLAPVALVVPAFHRWLEKHASSFAMNPAYVRQVTPVEARQMRRWELVVLAAWAVALFGMSRGMFPLRTMAIWYGVLAIATTVNTLRTLGAHDYDSDGSVGDRQWQLRDSLDTPGGPWTTVWAPVGLRYHALHHYFPGIPYHNLGEAYRRIVKFAEHRAIYLESTSPSLAHSLRALYQKAKRRAAAFAAAW
ncbi:MAG TPA: fatty acid desaturase, partial [Vicinamibacterales bacterium]|nr:fatty acid desaturase [Vicinamibacterales bacterium]